MNFSSVRQLEGDAMFRRPTLIIVVVGFLPPRTEALVLSPFWEDFCLSKLLSRRFRL